MKNTKNKRLFGLDLIRATAILFVILVHSFAYAGYYNMPMVGLKMFGLTWIRSLTFIGAPLFMLLTGYLKYSKKEDTNHLKKILPILIAYLLICVINTIFQHFYLGNIDTLNQIKGIFDFSNIGYSWYIEMYIGLFLIIPYLNKLYRNIGTKKEQQKFLLILLFIMSIPQTLNGMKVGNFSFNLLPLWWENLFPLLYYFIGCYIKENQVKIKKLVNFVLIIIIMFLQNYIIYHHSSHTVGLGYENIFTVLITLLVFLLLYDLTIRGKIISSLVSKVSIVSFNMYLFSYIFDIYFYDKFKNIITGSPDSVFKVIITVPIIVFITSFLSSFILDYFMKLGIKIIRFLQRHHKEKYNIS